MRSAPWLLVLFALLHGSTAAAEEPAPRPSVAVMKVAAMKGVSSDLANPVADLLANAIRSLGRFKVIGQADIETMLGMEEMRQKMGCTDTSCLAEIGGALGANYIISGNLSRLGSTLLLNLRLVDPRKGEVTKGVSRKIVGGDEGLIDAVPQVVAEIFDAEAPVIAETRTGDAPPPPPPPKKPKKRATVTVDIRTDVEGAEVYSNGRLLGRAPLLAELKRGRHRFTAKAEGYLGERKMRIRQATTVEITLKSLDRLQVEQVYRVDATARYKEWEASPVRKEGVSFAEYFLRVEYPGDFEDYQQSEEAGSVTLAAYLEGEFRMLRNVGIGLTFGVGLSAAVAAATISATVCPKKTDAKGHKTIDGDSTCAKATGWTLIPVSLGSVAAGIAMWVIYGRRAGHAHALTNPVETPLAASTELDLRLTPVLDARGVPGGLGLEVRF